MSNEEYYKIIIDSLHHIEDERILKIIMLFFQKLIDRQQEND